MSLSNYFDIEQSGAMLKLPAPSDMEITYTDIDDNSYRSKMSGNLIRKPISYKWIKVGLSYNWLDEQQATTLMNAFYSATKVKAVVKSPLLADAQGEKSYLGYVSELRAHIVKSRLGDGYSVSFNFIESTR